MVPHRISNRHCGGSGAFAHYIPCGDNSFGTEVTKELFSRKNLSNIFFKTLFKEGVLIEMIFLYLQDVLEERFRTEYLIAIVVAVGLLLIISLVVTTLLALRCQRSRAKRLRAAAIESSELQRSRSGGDLSNDTVATQVRKVHCIISIGGSSFFNYFDLFFAHY